MNIFVSSVDPAEAARWLDDSRVIKMTLESTQLLSTAYAGLYKPTHVNHPCTKWVKSSQHNAAWLLYHLIALSEEYTSRFHKVHACAQHISHFKALLPQTKTLPTLWVLCPPSVETSDPTGGYRDLLIAKWRTAKRPPRWTNAAPPPWYCPAQLSI